MATLLDSCGTTGGDVMSKLIDKFLDYICGLHDGHPLLFVFSTLMAIGVGAFVYGAVVLLATVLKHAFN